MGIFDWFRRPPRIADRASLADFLDTRAAFFAQKSIFDYTRGRAGPYFPQIIKEKEFSTRVDEARWRNYPYGLSMVAEMVHGVLLPAAGDAPALAAALQEISLDVFDRYPVPPMLGEEYWSGERAGLATRIAGIALHPPKPVKDIPMPFGEIFFNNMPIHERLREHDFELIRNHLRSNLLSMNRDFLKHADIEALVGVLLPAADRTAA